MHKNDHCPAIPHDSLITQGFGPISYADTFEASCPACYSIDYMTAKIFALPGWINILFAIRNALVRPFGLKTDIEVNKNEQQKYGIGERAVYFTVVNRTDNEIVMQENDSHLKFRVSVMARNKSSTLHITTIVHYNNMFGRVYFFAIKPFHKIILKHVLNRTAKHIRNNCRIVDNTRH